MSSSRSAFRIVVPSPSPDVQEHQLRLFEPMLEDPPSGDWCLEQFWRRWYVPALRNDRARRPVAESTIARRGASVMWWGRVMSEANRPGGPPLREISQDHLQWFRDRLRHAEFVRGPKGQYRPLSEMTQQRTLEDVQIVLAAAGPRDGRRIRAGVLVDPPQIYVEPAECWAKQTWSIEEARGIFRAIGTVKSIQPKARGSVFQDSAYLALSEATLSLWYYTGHRAGTYARIRWRDFRPEEHAGGLVQWYLFLTSIKTRKQDKVAVHGHLRHCLERCRGLDAELILPWPLGYSAICDLHLRWQTAAGLSRLRSFPPQAWRRLHLAQLAATDYERSRDLMQQAAGHSSSMITESHYYSVLNAHRLRLATLDGSYETLATRTGG